MNATTERPTPADLPAGTLIRVQPHPRYTRIPASNGIVVTPYGPEETAHTRDMVLVWFWGLGAPVPGTSVHLIFPAEITPLHTTLDTMPAPVFDTLAQTAVAHRDALPWDDMKPLADAINAAAQRRQS
ncbi:MAG: hypothetical protein JO362_22045 [Streptomycetaceae bacterium]|nr:hypothetical protein [Streptomycetaceae bacterium]